MSDLNIKKTIAVNLNSVKTIDTSSVKVLNGNQKIGQFKLQSKSGSELDTQSTAPACGERLLKIWMKALAPRSA